jgi:foldase protein PrsA
LTQEQRPDDTPGERPTAAIAAEPAGVTPASDPQASTTGSQTAQDSSNMLEEPYADDSVYEDPEQGFIHIRTSLFAVAATVVSLLLLVLLAGNVYQYVHNRSQTEVATVNGAPITQAEFLRAAGQQDQALQSLIDEKLIQQEAKKQKVTVSDSEVDSEIGTIKQQLGTQQDFNAALQRANLTEPQLRDQIRTQKLAQKMGANGVTVSDDDAQTYYNQNKAQFGNQTFDQSKDQIKTQLLQQKQTEAVQTWISGLRSQAKIVIHMPA